MTSGGDNEIDVSCSDGGDDDYARDIDGDSAYDDENNDVFGDDIDHDDCKD